MYQTRQVVLWLSLAVILSSCSLFNSQGPEKKQTILEVGDQDISVDEFRYVYEKNNSDDPDLYSEESLKDYADLYKNFKLKVEAAKDAGLDTLPKLNREFRSYREQLAEPYLRSDSIKEALLKEAYQRRLKQVKAQHISIRVPRGAPAQDTAQALKRLKTIRDKATSGKDFEILAKAYKDKVNAGSLGYFTVFDQPYPIENIAYNMAPGNISKPVRTDFGYHLIKVNDKRPYKGKIQAKHIMIKEGNGNNSSGKANRKARKKIDSLYKAIQEGADFSRVAKLHSDDRRSSRQGGDLPLFDRSNPNFPVKFKEKAFSIKQDGKMTEPFQTRYGYHILKRVKIKGPDSFEAMKPRLEKQLKKSKRYEKVKSAVVNQIKQDHNYKRYLKDWGPLENQLDSTFKTGDWRIKNREPLKKKLFTIEDTTYQLLEFASYLESMGSQKLGQYQYPSYALNDLFEDFERKKLLAYKRNNLKENYPEYRHLLKEYKEGVLLFEIMDRKVWSEAVEDSAGLRNFYQKHREDYDLPSSKVVTYYRFPSKKGQKQAYQQLQAGEAHKVVKQNLENNFNGNDWSHRKDTVQEGQLAFMKKAGDEPDLYRFQHKSQHYVVDVEEVMDGDNAPFEAVRGKVVADYQEHLESQWLDSLEERYTVNLHEDVLQSLVNKN